MSFRSIALVVVAAVSGCTTDDKGLSCALADVYIAADGKTWCPDPAAPGDCERVRDAMVTSFVRCGTDDDANDAAERTFDCSTAVTTTTSLNECLAALDDDDTCLATAADLPDDCVDAVVLQPG